MTDCRPPERLSRLKRLGSDVKLAVAANGGPLWRLAHGSAPAGDAIGCDFSLESRKAGIVSPRGSRRSFETRSISCWISSLSLGGGDARLDAARVSQRACFSARRAFRAMCDDMPPPTPPWGRPTPSDRKACPDSIQRYLRHHVRDGCTAPRSMAKNSLWPSGRSQARWKASANGSSGSPRRKSLNKASRNRLDLDSGIHKSSSFRMTC
jgi:hypothetical protein